MSTSEAPTTSATESGVAANTTRLVFLASLTVLAYHRGGPRVLTLNSMDGDLAALLGA